jgi:hypothetical protein
MTFHRWDTVDETTQGVGQVRQKGKVIADATYNLRIESEEITARSFSMNETRFTRKTVTGEVCLLDGTLLPDDHTAVPGGSFTLVLDDGREVDFRVKSQVVRQNPTRQECRIHGSGNRFQDTPPSPPPA